MTHTQHNTSRLARNTDPVTSHMAAEQVELFALKHEDRIYRALDIHGAMTADEIAARTGLLAHQVNKRLPEMQRKFKAAPTSALRESNSGRMERVWRCIRGAK